MDSPVTRQKVEEFKKKFLEFGAIGCIFITPKVVINTLEGTEKMSVEDFIAKLSKPEIKISAHLPNTPELLKRHLSLLRWDSERRTEQGGDYVEPEEIGFRKVCRGHTYSERKDGFYYWDESASDAFGPFPSADAALAGSKEYSKTI